MVMMLNDFNREFTIFLFIFLMHPVHVMENRNDLL